ncbi:MAG: VCBS repeat-containing protein, partial [Flavobacteriaceae bacterium]
KMVSGPDNYDKNSLLEENGFYHQIMRNMMHLNNNGEYFSEIGQFSGISNTDWSWASLFADFDNDGFKDVFITNGIKKDYTNMDFMNFAVQERMTEMETGIDMAIPNLLENIPATIEENYTYHNNGDLTFTKVNEAWGLNQMSLSNGAAYADLDNDGDLDLLVNNTDDIAFVYRNNSNLLTNNHFLKFSFKGEGKNTFGIGAKVVLAIGEKLLSQEVMPTRGFQSSVDLNLVFGLGEADTVDEVKVIWPDGKVQMLKNIASNQTLVLKQADAKKEEAKTIMPRTTYFTDISVDSLINFKHHENSYNDFTREQLLPHKLSTLGPKIAKADVNNDGREDIYIGGAKGQSGQLMLQTKSGKFIESKQKAIENDQASEDLDALFFDADNDNDLDLYVVSGGNDFDLDSPELQDRLYLNNGRGSFTKSTTSLPSMLTSSSCVKASDVDGDGDLDLFVGGRLVPGRYPTAPRSYILQNNGKGTFTDVTMETNTDLVNPGMVTDAIWSDFTGDGTDDLIIVGEFMPVRAFENNNGTLNEVSDNSGLANSEGWWNSVKQGDFDNDGDMDYILGNFGLNSQLKASEEEPVTLYYKDFDSNGSIDPILCSYVMGESYPVFSKDDFVGQLSKFKGKYVNYADYADAKISDIFSAEELKDAGLLKVTNFATSYMENLGNSKFRISPLPTTAQFSPVYGILVDDVDGDGNMDILVAGNFFGTRVKYGRYDANKGVLLRGDGKGNFHPVATTQSGLNIDGEVRDMELIQVGDKNVLLIARNNAAVKTYFVQPKTEK